MATVQQANEFIKTHQLRLDAQAARQAQEKAEKRSYWSHVTNANKAGYTPLSLTDFTAVSIAIITSNRVATVNRRSI